MKKLLFLAFFLSLTTLLYAEKPPLPATLEWKYGACAGLKQSEDTGDLYIYSWRCADPQPSKEQMEIDRQEYKDYLIAEKQARKARKQAIRQKLGMTQGEIKNLTELVQDGNED